MELPSLDALASAAGLDTEDLGATTRGARDLESILQPVVVRGAAPRGWPSLGAFLVDFAEVATQFRLYPLDDTDVPWETHCAHEKATFGEFERWMGGASEPGSVGRLADYDPGACWAYADYKYAPELFSREEVRASAVSGGPTGHASAPGGPFAWFALRLGAEHLPPWLFASAPSAAAATAASAAPTSHKECGLTAPAGADAAARSVLWVGTRGASTQCHFDTYGRNVVLQVAGRKRWTLVPPGHVGAMRATRLPYEESSVFSALPAAALRSSPLVPVTEVELGPGDLLLLPKHWWHHVECLEPSLSINVWVEHSTDARDRVAEAATRAMLTGLLADPRQGAVVRGSSASVGAACTQWEGREEEEGEGEEEAEAAAAATVGPPLAAAATAAANDGSEDERSWVWLNPTESPATKARCLEWLSQALAGATGRPAPPPALACLLLARAATRPDVVATVTQCMLEELADMARAASES